MNKCNVCGKVSKIGAQNMFDKKVFCMDCLSYVDGYYGFASSKILTEYIKSKKAKKWWMFWK